MSSLTLRKLKNTRFPELYEKLVIGNELSNSDKRKMLQIALILLNTDDNVLQKLGYRMILKYSNMSGDYIPLYDVSINEGYIPISKYIEMSYLQDSEKHNSFMFNFISSFEENFRKGDIYLTEEQLDLNEFFDMNNSASISVVAPTSYGKSELIMSCISDNPNSNICILVPTKSLLAQTKRRILGHEKFDRKRKIITHPEMYLNKDENFISVLTQERLLKLLQKDSNLSFDYIVVDEAHNLLSCDSRSKLLASSIILLNSRNKKCRFKYLSPFVLDTDNLNISYTDIDKHDFRVSENIKSENYYHYNFYDNKPLILYYQFMNLHYQLPDMYYSSDIELIQKNASLKNVIYFNKPSNIEAFANKLLKTESIKSNVAITNAIEDIRSYIHSDYLITECLERGFVYHHGSVPDNIRLYIEHLFSSIPELKYIVTSSTLLEGVNIPADKMFLLENKKGRSTLSYAQFKNLVGRVSRFGDIFDLSYGSLERLEPNVYLIKSEYMAKNSNLKSYLERTVKMDKKYGETPENVLLENTLIDENNRTELNESIQFLENQEVGSTQTDDVKYAKTEVGQSCFKNNILEFDILRYESSIQSALDHFRDTSPIINDHNEILKLVSELFISKIESDNYRNLKRLEEESARKFYNMFLSWKIKQSSYREMVYSFVKYWKKLVDDKKDTKVYVGKWGDETRANPITGEEGYLELWTDLKKKNRRDLVNLAIVRIKEEQDFLENNLMKFVECLYELEVIEKSLYSSIKYGTDDEVIITLIRNGIGLQTSKLLMSTYRKFVKVDVENSQIHIKNDIIPMMKENGENEVVIYEVTCAIGID